MDPLETVEYKGYTIEIYQDEYPEDPHYNSTMPPMVVYMRHGVRTFGDIDLNPPPLTLQQIRENAKEIAEILGESTLLEGISENIPEPRSYYYGDTTAAINDALYNALCNLFISDRMQYMEALATTHKAAGRHAVFESRHGYSQGDYAEILAVATPRFLDTTGITADHEEALLQYINTYASWLWGDVYGYSITKKCSCCGQSTKTVDESCWGFYGDPEKTGLIEDAKGIIDYLQKDA